MGGASVSGFDTNDTIAIRQIASVNPSTTTQASVSVGATTSSTWSVTTTASTCGVALTPGAVCTDGTVYAGISIDGSYPMFVTPCDANAYWSGSSCTACGTGSGHWTGSGTSCATTYSGGPGITWNNNSTNYIATGYTSNNTGRDNTTGLAALVDVGSPYKAAQYCENLTAYGHSDWYLPARAELGTLYSNNAAIGNFDTGGNYYWSSTEYTSTNASYQRFSDGNQGSYTKYNSYLIRCARR